MEGSDLATILLPPIKATITIQQLFLAKKYTYSVLKQRPIEIFERLSNLTGWVENAKQEIFWIKEMINVMCLKE